uniref:hypothetical protein n=1 Tax=Azospirillum argentinense TaxID=2970906 RepID=UPI001586D191|nr:hypothetical protein [Azospirillum argentinense]
MDQDEHRRSAGELADREPRVPVGAEGLKEPVTDLLTVPGLVPPVLITGTSW